VENLNKFKLSKNLHPKNLLLTIICGFVIISSTPLVYKNYVWSNYNRLSKLQNSIAIFNYVHFLETNTYSFQENAWLIPAGFLIHLASDENMFFEYWEDKEVTSDFFELWGDFYHSNKAYEDSLDFYILARNADVDIGSTKRIESKMGLTCQKLFSQLETLAEKAEYCRKYFLKNNLNLIVDGSIESNDLSLWKYRFFEKRDSATYEVVRDSQDRNNAIRLIGHENKYHGGVYQSISITRGSCILYSAKIKFGQSPSYSAQLLYMGGIYKDTPFGSQLLVFDSQSSDFKFDEWIYLEREILIPVADGHLFEVYPVLLSGKGSVWLDDITITQVNPEEFCQ
jgi:hypothetical protein